MFDHHLLDMVEFSIENFSSLSSFRVPKCAAETKPCLIFIGDPFREDPKFQRIKSIFIDFFRGPVIDSLRLQGIEHALVFTASAEKILLRSYRILLKKSGTRLPRVELLEIGPRMDLSLRRTKFASDDLFRRSLRQPKEAKIRKRKNVDEDVFGTKMGRIHVGKQDLGKIQTRKLRALKNTEEEKEVEMEEVVLKKKRRVERD